MGFTVTDEMISKIREQEEADQGDSEQGLIELDHLDVLTSEDWEKEFEIIRGQIEEDVRLELLHLAVPPQPPTWIIEDYFNSTRQQSVEKSRRYREVCGGSKLASRAELSSLAPITLGEMQIGKSQHGRVLFCRTTTLPSVTNAIRIIVVDTVGTGAILELFHHPILPVSLGNLTRQDYDDAFEIQTILAIKEPRMTLNSTLMTVKVESLTDVCVPQIDDAARKGTSWVGKDGEQVRWRSEHEGHAKDSVEMQQQLQQRERRYLKIERLLGRAVSANSSDRLRIVDFLLDRARNRLLLERYQPALCDVIEAEPILIDQKTSKPDDLEKHLQECTTLRARCFYGLAQWEKAEEAYRMVIGRKSSSEKDPIAMELKRCRYRIEQQATGEYSDVDLFHQVHRDGRLRLDIGNYIGPIEVAEYPKMRRGYRTTRDVKAGELLLADKAFALVEPVKAESNVGISFTGFNLHTHSIEATGSYALRTELAYKAMYQPDVRRGLRKLYSGDNSARSAGLAQQLESADHPLVVDNQHIDGIVTLNLFGPRDLDYAAFAGKDGTDIGNERLGLYQNASLFNHSCLNNAYWVCMGDVLFVRATEFLPARTQVLINYCSNTEYLDRRAALGRFLGKAGCSCRLCQDDQDDGGAAMAIRKNVVDTRLQEFYGAQALDATVRTQDIALAIA